MAVALAAAGVGGGLTLYRQMTYGNRYDESRQDITVPSGTVFSLVVPDRGPSVGDKWTAGIYGDAEITQVHSTLIADNLFDRWFGPAPGGGGGQRVITFRADTPGTATITLENCYRGCDSERNRTESRSVSWDVTVSR